MNQNHETTKMVVSNIHTYYGDAHILQGCSLEVESGCVAVLGRNGMGKTTLMRSLMGLTPPREGSIQYKGMELIGKAPYEISNLGLGYVPQGRKLFPSLSVEEHLTLHYKKRKVQDEWTPKRVFELFPEIERRRKISGARLSGGEQQMLAIGRALVTNPDILLLDEPSEGLAPIAIDRVVETCKELIKSKIAVLIVEQNFHVAESLADYVYILDKGRAVYSGNFEDFKKDPTLRLRYLGI